MVPLATPWTAALVASRAVDLVRAQNAVRRARLDYRDACAKYRSRNCASGFIDKACSKFRRSTRKMYEAFQHARREENNARRRLETAVRRLGRNPICSISHATPMGGDTE